MGCRRCSSSADLEGEPVQSERGQPEGRARHRPVHAGTAADRGLDDPFEPKSAIVHSASLLADLASEFGNVGLAAAAYNAGAERVRAWLDGQSRPAVRRPRLCVIRHRPRRRGMEAAGDRASRRDQEPTARSCGFVPQARAARGARGVRDRAADRERSVAALGHAGVDGVLQGAGAVPVRTRSERRYASVLVDREPFVLPERNMSRGRRSTVHGADRRRQPRRRRQALRRSSAAPAALASCRKIDPVFCPSLNVSVATGGRWYKVRSATRGLDRRSQGAHRLREQIGRAETPNRSAEDHRAGDLDRPAQSHTRRRRPRSRRPSRSTFRRARSNRRSRPRAASIRRTARNS